jgi:cell division protein FtsB
VLRASMVFVTCVVFADAMVGERGLAQRSRARQDFAASEDALRDLQIKNAGLREQVRRLKSDPATIEAVAREELGLIRPGELLFVVKKP